VDDAIFDMSEWKATGMGYIICEDLEIGNMNYFAILLPCSESNNSVLVTRALLKRLPDGRIKFSTKGNFDV